MTRQFSIWQHRSIALQQDLEGNDIVTNLQGKSAVVMHNHEDFEDECEHIDTYIKLGLSSFDWRYLGKYVHTNENFEDCVVCLQQPLK